MFTLIGCILDVVIIIMLTRRKKLYVEISKENK